MASDHKSLLNRRIRKSPKRHSPASHEKISVDFDPRNLAYADPTDSLRSVLTDVLFQRDDHERISQQAEDLFSSVENFPDEIERSWLLNNIRTTTIWLKIEQVTHRINGNYFLRENRPTVLLLHGFGAVGNWANWIKLAFPLAERGLYSVIFVDLPGFGQSSGRDLDQTNWKRHGPELILGILSSFHIDQPVHAIAQCGGAATIVRTINRYPCWFRGRGHVFSNSVIGDFGEKKIGDFENNLIQFNIRILVYWIPDQDHTQKCVAYKRWNKLRQTGFRNLHLIDLDPKTQKMKVFSGPVRVKNISRCSSKNKAFFYKFSNDFLQQTLDALNGKHP